MTRRTSGKVAKSSASARRMAAPSALSDGGRSVPAKPPPVTYSWMNTDLRGPDPHMRIIPVLDLKAGLAVHAVAGDRAYYQPIRSILHQGSDPIGLARAYRDKLGLSDLYVADLDAIA